MMKQSKKYRILGNFSDLNLSLAITFLILGILSALCCLVCPIIVQFYIEK